MAVSVDRVGNSMCAADGCDGTVEAAVRVEHDGLVVDLFMCEPCAVVLQGNENEAWDLLRLAHNVLGPDMSEMRRLNASAAIAEYLNL